MTVSVSSDFGSGNCTQDAVHRRIGVQRAYQLEQIILRNIRRQSVLERGHARGLRLGMLAADIDFAGRIVADQHDREPRRQAMLTLDPCDLVGDAGAQLRGNGFPSMMRAVISVLRFDPSVRLRSACLDRRQHPKRLAEALGVAVDRDLLEPRGRPRQQPHLGLGHAKRLRQQFRHRTVASPPSAMARTLTFMTLRPLANVSIPSISSRPPRGVTRSATLIPSVE